MQHDSRHTRQVGWRYASAADIEALYGHTLDRTVRAVALLLDDEVEGIIGVSRDKVGLKFFSDYTDDMEQHLHRFPALRAIKVVMGWVETAAAPVGAVAEHEEGHRLLNRLGFGRVFGDQYRWHYRS